MLSTAGVFESKLHSATDIELGQSVMRVLLAAVSHHDKAVHTVVAHEYVCKLLVSHLSLPPSLPPSLMYIIYSTM